MKLTYTAPMHGRHATVRKAYNRNVQAGIIDFVYCVTDRADLDFLDQFPRTTVVESCQNNVNEKAQMAIAPPHSADAVILMGSDDYIDHAAYLMIERLLKDHDYIAFDDCYFHSGGQIWRWPGYPEKHPRNGEPAGAGKVIRMDLLNRMDGRVWMDYYASTDFSAHNRISQYAKSPARINCKRDGVQLVDIKDGDSLTPLSNLNI